MMSGTRVQVPQTLGVLVCRLTVAIEQSIEDVENFGVLLEGGCRSGFAVGHFACSVRILVVWYN